MMDWQPIETAPKDGTHILAFRMTERGPDILQAWWQKTIFDDFVWGGYGWSYPEFSQPTHWMPLPAPPVQP